MQAKDIHNKLLVEESGPEPALNSTDDNSVDTKPASKAPEDAKKSEATELQQTPVASPTSPSSEAPADVPADIPSPVVEAAAPSSTVTTVAPNKFLAEAQAALAEPAETFKFPLINLLGHDDPAPAPPPVPPVAPQAVPRRSRKIVIAAAATVMLLAAGSAGGYVYYQRLQSPEVAVQPPPAVDPPPVAPPPEPPPAPAPAPVPEPDTVTAPTTTPTPDNPQTVTVQSPSGLWLRSTPNSDNRSNIISWIPNGGQVSVDQINEYWWHGTYKGKTGYFYSKYTK